MPVYVPGGPYSGGGAFTSGNANNIEGGVGGAYQKDGSDPMTAGVKVSVTGGADVVLADFTVSSGKRIQILERNSDKAVIWRNFTDSKDFGVLQTDGTGNVLTANQAPAPVFIGPIGSRPAAGNKWRLAFITPFS